uniref:Protein kinase domain-containing protein n=1 Tax=Oryza punctata TaxID=4537 RepID=A0A0E0MLW5_ORYPU
MATTSSVVISRFVKLDELASGAYGIVYRTRDRRSRSTLGEQLAKDEAAETAKRNMGGDNKQAIEDEDGGEANRRAAREEVAQDHPDV